MHDIKRIVAATFMGHFTNDGLVLMIPLLIPFIARDFNLSYTQIGILGGSLVLSMGAGEIFTGYLSDFSKVKWPFVSLGLVILSLSLFGMSMSSTYTWLIVFNLLAGIGASFYHPCGVALLAKSMKGNIRGKILAIHGVGGGIGILIFPVVAGLILSTWSWAHALKFLSPAGIIAASLFFFAREEPVYHAKRKRSALLTKESILMIALFGCMAMFFRGFITFLPVQLEEFGYSAVSITTVVTLFYGTGVVGEICAGFLTDLYSRRKILFTSLLGASLFVVILFKSVWLFIIPLGFFAYVVWVPATAVYVEGIPEAWYGTALGVLQGLAGLMAFLSPMTMGIIAEKSGISVSFFFLSGVALFGALISLKVNYKKRGQNLLPSKV